MGIKKTFAEYSKRHYVGREPVKVDELPYKEEGGDAEIELVILFVPLPEFILFVHIMRFKN